MENVAAYRFPKGQGLVDSKADEEIWSCSSYLSDTTSHYIVQAQSKTAY